MNPVLSGLHIAILVMDGFEQVEFTDPRTALEAEGATVRVISGKHGNVQGFHHDAKGDAFPVDLTFDEADPKDFDAAVLPGGVMNADQIRLIPQAQQFIRHIDEEGKPIAVICHGAWLLVSAGLVEGRTLTSWPTLQDDIRNAGANWVDQEVVRDGNWVSSRKPADIPAFNRETIALMQETLQAHLRGTADERAVGIASS